jgi:hypothetical protein
MRNSSRDEILRKQFVLKVSELEVDFYLERIKNDGVSDHLHYINLANTLLVLNRREEAYQWLMIL